MSITLTAFPTAFLISPEKAKNVSITKILENVKEKGLKSLVSNFSALKNVKVLTNLRMGTVPYLMSVFKDAKRTGDYSYKLGSGLTVEWKYIDDHCYAILSGRPAYKIVPNYAEKFFKKIEEVTGNNIRDINSEEYFYYNYETEYQSADQILEILNHNGALNIKMVSDNEIRAYFNNQNIRYYLEKDSKNFTLETEQKISLVNIGIDNSMISNVVIKTNIKPEEIQGLLNNFGYEFNELTSSTPLKMSSDILKWELVDGMYNLHANNIKPSHLRGEIEHLFVAMNKKAGRDLRLIENKASFTYTYKTNYTDKGILINTLTEHGAKNISETSEGVKCELFGMEMVYTKDNETNAYNLIIERVTDKSECEGLISELNDEYGLNIQELTYKKILERLDKENMRLENEEVMDDNSIVLTIEI